MSWWRVSNLAQLPHHEDSYKLYERLHLALNGIRRLRQLAEMGISPSRDVVEFTISPRGDTFLAFARTTAEPSDSHAVVLFRVSLRMLAKTSPIFACMFFRVRGSPYLDSADSITDQLPPPPTRLVWSDEHELEVFSMPQFETNRLRSMEILLHAAHIHHRAMPRHVSLDQFVAIAECSLRYKSSFPLRNMVENRWLVQWMHKAAEDDNLLVISYAFRAREIFTRLSKRAILNVVDSSDLNSKPWPQRVKNQIWVTRCNKEAEVYARCRRMLHEHLRTRSPHEPNLSNTTALVSRTQCPQGSHSCDAANLGWVMLMYNEMDLLPRVMGSAAFDHLPSRPRSLAQLLDLLRRMPSPASPVHQAAECNPIPAFRAAIAEIHRSVKMLKLQDMSSKIHDAAPPDTFARLLESRGMFSDGQNQVELSNEGFQDSLQRHSIRRVANTDTGRATKEPEDEIETAMHKNDGAWVSNGLSTPSVYQPEGHDQGVQPMTDEEAWQILWPKDISHAPGDGANPPREGLGSHEKFRSGDPWLVKSLIRLSVWTEGREELRVEYRRHAKLMKHKQEAPPRTDDQSAPRLVQPEHGRASGCKESPKQATAEVEEDVAPSVNHSSTQASSNGDSDRDDGQVSDTAVEQRRLAASRDFARGVSEPQNSQGALPTDGQLASKDPG